MGEIDLQAAFLGAGPAAEDLEDQAGAVQHLDVPGSLQIALLNRRQGCIDDDQFDIISRERALQLINLAGAEQGCRTHLRKRHDLGQRDVQVDGKRQPDRFLKPCFRLYGRRALVDTVALARATHRRVQHGRTRRFGFFDLKMVAVAGSRSCLTACFVLGRRFCQTILPCCCLPRRAERVDSA